MSWILHLCAVLLLFNTFAGVDSCMRKPAKVKVTCPEDKRVVADRKLNNALVKWSRNEFKTESTHPIRGIYQTIPIYAASANVQRHFEEGSHHVEYKAVDEGGRFGSCSFEVHVKVIRCSKVYNPEHGFITCDAGHVFGSQCTVSCIPGYSVKGLSEITCLSNGSWSAAKPACIALTCPDPGTPIHGDRYCNTITHAVGSICSFSCNSRYHLVGSSRIICDATENGTRWTNKIPRCQEITPPRAEACPQDINETTGSSTIEIHKPEIRFVTSVGEPAPYACSHFGSRDSYNFTIGRHRVTCTAYDPKYPSDASARCTFQVIIEPNPCRQLAKPRNGKLICSRSDGASIKPPYDTACELHCNASYMLPRQDGNVVKTFSCNTIGQWIPHHYVPSCVRPRRPQELKLPSEIYYTTPTNCTNAKYLKEIKTKFQSAVQTTIRNQEDCARTPGDCIVDDVETNCWNQSEPNIASSKIRHSYRRTLRYINKYSGVSGPNTHNGEQKVESPQFVIPIQFHYGTRIPEVGGEWPDEYHNAYNRLYGMYDYFERQVNDGNFRLETRISGVNMTEERGSLTFTNGLALCDVGYTFDMNTLFCVPCGPGSFYNRTKDRCQLCDRGQYQSQEAKLGCIPCPDGTTSLDMGASSRTQCVEIDECESSPCENEGICEDQHASFKCLCKPGYAGVVCSNRVYNCSAHACLNGGTCIPDGDNNYTCQCRQAYSGEYCQYHSIHGNWGSWLDWSPCSKSCEGGVQTRSRLCDSPPPSNGGEPCKDAALQERVCNDHPCPVCKILRRPYGGNIKCKKNETEDLTSCTIFCNPGYAFSDPVLPVYNCGRNTSYLWPHESPDNPRCILPSCTKIEEPVEETFEFKATVSTSVCTPEIRLNLGNEIKKRSMEYTTDLHCLGDGSCELQTPEISECHSTSSRSRRSVNSEQVLTDLTFKVSVLFKGKPQSPMQGKAKKTKQELSNLGNRIVREVKEHKLNLNISGAPLTIKSDSVVTTASPVCEKGMVPCADEDCCAECCQGSYYNDDRDSCVLCSNGYYQPLPKQLSCIECPPNQTTYGRGAVFDIECYPKGEVPPTIPENYTNIPDNIPLENNYTSTMILAISVPLVSILVILIALCVLIWKIKKRKVYKADKRRRQESSTRDPEERTSLTKFSQEKG